MRNLILDTETTGLGPDSGLVEIGWLEIDEDLSPIGRVQSLIDPMIPINPSASAIHGIVKEDVEDAPTLTQFFSMAANGCYGQRLKGPITLIGHNIAFDYGYVKDFIDGEVHQVCTLRFARLLYPDSEDHKLQTLKYALGLERAADAAHRVMADINDTHNLLKHLCLRLGMTLAGLRDRAKQPFPVSRMPFGKHKGTPLRELPRNYVRWLQREAKLDIDLETALNEIFGAQS